MKNTNRELGYCDGCGQGIGLNVFKCDAVLEGKRFDTSDHYSSAVMELMGWREYYDDPIANVEMIGELKKI